MTSNDIFGPATIATLSVLSLVAGPILCSLAVSFCVARRRKPRLVLLAIVPLALTSISIQLVAAAFVMASGFRDIAEQKASGMVAVTSIIASAGSPLLWRFVEAALCVAIAAIIAPWVWGRARSKAARGKEVQPSLQISHTTLALSAAALIAVVALVWFYHDIVELCMLIVDPCRTVEAHAALANVGPSDVASTIGRGVVILMAGASALSLCLTGIGFHCLHTQRRTKWGLAASLILAISALAWLGMSVSAEWRARNYFQGKELSSGATQPIYHRYFRSVTGYLLHSRASNTALNPSLDVQLPPGVNSYRMPDADRDDAVILTVTREGHLFFGQEMQVEPDNVADKVKDRLADRIDKTVYIRADARTRYGIIAQVFSQLRTAGVDVAALLTSGHTPCVPYGVDVLIPAPPLPSDSVSTPETQNSPFFQELRAPASVPTGTDPHDPIVLQVLRDSGGVHWKINRMEVSGLNDFSAQLESLLQQHPERIGFLVADENTPYTDFVDVVNAGKGAGLDRVAVVLENTE